MNIVKKPEEINSIEATEIEKNAKLTDEELAYILEVKTQTIFEKSWLRLLTTLIDDAY